jgi:methanesulfonate monooxygenase large subunit
MRPGTESRRILHGRQENQTIHDEIGMRHYYDEWGRWMNRLPNKPDQPWSDRASSQTAVAAAE